jgi:hypothetical protein
MGEKERMSDLGRFIALSFGIQRCTTYPTLKAPFLLD